LKQTRSSIRASTGLLFVPITRRLAIKDHQLSHRVVLALLQSAI
jgi:hypothetical protein